MQESRVLLAVVAGGVTVAALVRPGQEPCDVPRRVCANFEQFVALCRSLIDAENPILVGIAVAGDGRETGGVLTVAEGWTIDVRELRRRLDLPRAYLMNSHVAAALAAPRLHESHQSVVSPGRALLGQCMAVIAPALIAGASFMIPDSKGNWLALQSEGGGVTFNPSSEDETEVVRRAWKGPPTFNETLSFQGFEKIYAAVAALRGEAPPVSAFADIMALAGMGDPAAREAVRLYCTWLGGFSKGVALTGGCHGGVYLCGRIVREMASVFDAEAFRRGFRRFADASDEDELPAYLVRVSMALLGLSTLFHPTDARLGGSGVQLLDC